MRGAVTQKGTQSLSSFAAERLQNRSRRWCDDLPDDIKEQIQSAPDVSSRTIVDWLVSIGYTEATYAKVDGFRRDRARS